MVSKSQLPYTIERARVVSYDPRDPRSIAISLSGGRVIRNCTATGEVRVGASVLAIVSHYDNGVVVIGSVQDAVSISSSGTTGNRAALNPPANLRTANGVQQIVLLWDFYPGNDGVCYQVQHNAAAAEDGNEVLALVTKGSIYLYGASAGVTRYFRVRAVQWLSASNVLSSAWSNWVSGSAATLSNSDLPAPIDIAHGGTNATTANAAANNLLPSQAGKAGMVLTSDGANTSWLADGAQTVLFRSLTNANAASMQLGEAVYISGASTANKARGNALSTALAVGLVASASVAPAGLASVQLNGTLSGTTGQWDAVTGQTGGLTPGAYYYLSSTTAGKLAVTYPSTPGVYPVKVGIALSSTELLIDIDPGNAVISSGGGGTGENTTIDDVITVGDAGSNYTTLVDAMADAVNPATAIYFVTPGVYTGTTSIANLGAQTITGFGERSATVGRLEVTNTWLTVSWLKITDATLAIDFITGSLYTRLVHCYIAPSTGTAIKIRAGGEGWVWLKDCYITGGNIENDATAQLLVDECNIFGNISLYGDPTSVGGEMHEIRASKIFGDLIVGEGVPVKLVGLPQITGTVQNDGTIIGSYMDAAGVLHTAGQIASSVATGTAPMTVASTTMVTNLNAELLEGHHASEFLAAGEHVHAAQALFTIEGSLSVTSSPLRIYNTLGRELTISKVFLAAATAPVGASIIADIHKNGTTIFTTQGSRPAIADGESTGESATPDVTAWADGQYLTFDVDQVGSTVAGSSLTVHVVYSVASGPVASTDDHTQLANVGTNTHAQVDTALARLEAILPAGAAGHSAFWSGDAIGDSQTIIADGADDVTKVISLLYVASQITGTDVSGGSVVLEPGDTHTVCNDGTNALTLTCGANGSVTIARVVLKPGASDTYKFSAWMVWH